MYQKANHFFKFYLNNSEIHSSEIHSSETFTCLPSEFGGKNLNKFKKRILTSAFRINKISICIL